VRRDLALRAAGGGVRGGMNVGPTASSFGGFGARFDGM
jgi:hypothetical protein